MRKTINPQPNLREPWLELEHARELETISSLLDAHPQSSSTRVAHRRN